MVWWKLLVIISLYILAYFNEDYGLWDAMHNIILRFLIANINPRDE